MDGQARTVRIGYIIRYHRKRQQKEDEAAESAPVGYEELGEEAACSAGRERVGKGVGSGGRGESDEGSSDPKYARKTLIGGMVEAKRQL